ncbi:MAG: HAD family hydrolase [Chloroflexota bacterium]|nr:HAD family hydrolase [Chloroflexota bacterium]
MTEKITNVRLIACDYDGTLSAGPGELTERTKAALRLAHNKGVLLALVTGRSASFVSEKVRSLPFDFIITANGAAVEEGRTGQKLAATAIDRATALAVLDALEGFEYSKNLFLGGQYIMNPSTIRYYRSHRRFPFLQRLMMSLTFWLHARVSFNIPHLIASTNDPIEKIGCLFKTAEDCGAALDILRELDVVEAVTTHGRDLEITARDVSKGRALIALRESLGIAQEEVIAFGDSGNDLSMVDAVGCFLAPANATEDVKRAATHIIPSAAEDGVAIALEALFDRIELESDRLSDVASLLE